MLEVLAYAADEAESASQVGHCTVALHRDGSVSVSDDGRGTDTRRDEQGEPVKKPVMATKDLRFFDLPDAEQLPDGHPRRGMSVVAALSSWLVHTNRRLEGSWTQRYEHGIPVTGLRPAPPQSGTGTTVHFLPDASIDAPKLTLAAELVPALAAFTQLDVEIVGARGWL
ncbi:hypothetical protein LWF15_01015 [Kineosporia rhizophila]|uniref:hypothetical protein n=1 Tax=Kineosporia rhizophila TaxID=84633 RepID=UPI001E60B394|nr:hypothetical protein [Kineosporia rhizophila]MCE0534087.1 hypothetical protein [Kineosporia rhizophila]